MKISGWSVRRPVFTSMATLIVVTLGLFSVARLPIDLLPEISLPRMTIATTYENASPAEVEELITRPIERAVAAVPGVEEMTSSSSEGISSVSIGFVWGTNLDAAANDVRDRLDRTIQGLPDGADRPRLRMFDASSFPIVMIGIASPMDPIQLRTFIDQSIQYRLERVPGVAAVDAWGGLEREIRIEADPDQLRAFDLSLDDITQVIRDANVTLPAGDIEEGINKVTLRAPGLFLSVDQIGQTVVASRGGAPVYLKQVARVTPTHREITRIIRINGEPGVRLGVRKQSSTNTVDVARAVQAEVARINAEFSQVEVVIISDTSEYIERSIANLVRSIAAGGLLAVVILLFFLRSVLSSLIIATAIPVSIIATFTLIYFGGLTLNLMTLGGLALGVGMMVDSSIVVLENIFRLRQREGQSAQAAAILGAGEVTAAIIASTLTTLVIFLPLIFVQGTTGILFRQLAFVVAFGLVCSLFAALTIVPMLAARLPEGTGRGAGGKGVGARLAKWSRDAFHRLEEGYAEVLELSLGHRLITVGGAFLLLGGSLMLVPKIGQEFMPASDEGEVRVNAEMAVGTRLELVDEVMRRIEAIVIPEVPEIRTSQVSVGASTFRPGASATGELRLSLVPLSQRSRSSAEIGNDVRRKLTGMPGVTIRVREGQGLSAMRLVSGGGDESLSVEVRGPDLPTLEALAGQAREAMETISGITDVRVSREAGVPQQMIRIDRDRAADFGLSVSRIARTLQAAVGGVTAGQFREGGDEVRMQVRLLDADTMSLDDVLDVTIPAPGGPVALRSVAQLEFEWGPIQIDRKEQQRVAYVSANIAGRDLGSIARDVEAALADIPLPAYHSYFLGGDYEEQKGAFLELLISLALALALVFMVMACLYEGFKDPVIVMFSVPLAAIGALLMLFITGSTLNVQSFIGLIMLGGIVVNNAILIVDQASRLRREDGWLVRAAVGEAGRRRLRPVLMTSLTTMFALTPLALGWGEGGEAQAPLARTVIGGLFSSSLITLFVIPSVYTFFHRDSK